MIHGAEQFAADDAQRATHFRPLPMVLRTNSATSEIDEYGSCTAVEDLEKFAAVGAVNPITAMYA